MAGRPPPFAKRNKNKNNDNNKNGNDKKKPFGGKRAELFNNRKPRRK